ncbi:MAG: SAM-dependent methyltransferase [Deltaproteobacteria bacterium HGW-Deltaproteobacteria-15]|jgi:SAM-dependent methyltransferase|nr:MAG: SAM-dependent methyltransferase [Deltaproteobacteria bacterium HGW-Deltaproteobacteria-15]
MILIEWIHEKFVYGHRIRILSQHLSSLIPKNANILDVGCGDGFLDYLIMQQRRDVSIQGIDVLMREAPHIQVAFYDGVRFPFTDSHFDVVLLVDVLHHLEDPMALLHEVRRVTRDCMILKDHLREGMLANSTLRFMDNTGNRRFGVSLTYNYWNRKEWQTAFSSLGMTVTDWREHLGLYPWPASMFFDRSLHFIAKAILS